MFEVSMFSLPALQPAAGGLAVPWAAVRRAPRPTDLTLTDVARTWLHRLPVRRRPTRLAAQFPRLANRLALCWGDSELALQALDDLLQDRRGGRRGFPLQVGRELQRLRAYRAA
jgi:hypothetical protein